VPGEHVVVHDDAAGEQDDAKFPGHAEDDAADDVPDPDLGRTLAGRADGQEYVLEGEHEGGDGGAEQGALDPVVLEDSFGSDAGRGGAGDEADERDEG
jgi:hypothetical protein